MSIDLRRIDGINRHETQFLYDEIFVRRAYQPPGTRLPGGAVVVDVGANIGMYSLFVQSVCPDAVIYAFEPVPPVVAKLRSNVTRYGIPAKVLPYGLSDADREFDFIYYPGYSTMSTRTDYADTAAEKEFVRRRVLDSGQDSEVLAHLDELLDIRFLESTHRCRVRRLSDVIDEFGITRIDMAKIDVQRAELDVLNGVEDRHWGLIRQLVVEVHDEPGTPTAGRLTVVADQLADRGFTVRAAQDGPEAETDRYTVFAVRE